MLGADSWLASTPCLTIAIALLIFPLTLVRNLSSLGVVATAGSLVLFAFVAALISMAAAEGHGLGGIPAGRSGLQSALAAGSIAFSYDCQVNVFANYRELDRPAGGKAVTLAKCSGVAILASMVVYFSTALAGYSLYGEGVDGNVLSSMPMNVVSVVLNIAVFVVVVPDIPLLSYEVAAILQDHLLGHSFAANLGSNFMFIATSVLVAIYIPSMQTAFAYVGATTAVALNAILPPLFYLALASSLSKDGRSESASARDAYVDKQLSNAPSAGLRGNQKEVALRDSLDVRVTLAARTDGASNHRDDDRSHGSALRPVQPSGRLRKICIVYLSFGSVLLPVMLVLVSKGQ